VDQRLLQWRAEEHDARPQSAQAERRGGRGGMQANSGKTVMLTIDRMLAAGGKKK
jgi:hypothetical protein